MNPNASSQEQVPLLSYQEPSLKSLPTKKLLAKQKQKKQKLIKDLQHRQRVFYMENQLQINETEQHEPLQNNNSSINESPENASLRVAKARKQ